MTDLFRRFAALHRPGDPLVLFNVWDAGSAKAVAAAGAQALATGSASVAGAQGFDDGEALPLGLALANVERIAKAVDLPVTLDFEGGYAVEPEPVAANVVRAQDAGATGINFEDQRVGGAGLHDIGAQAARIAAIRAAVGPDFFVNARTDLFLQADPEKHGSLIDTAVERARAYAEAGASGFFAPLLADEALIARLAGAIALPLNIMAFPGAPSAERLAAAGVARISHGPFPWRQAMAALTEAARAALSPP